MITADFKPPETRIVRNDKLIYKVQVKRRYLYFFNKWCDVRLDYIKYITEFHDPLCVCAPFFDTVIVAVTELTAALKIQEMFLREEEERYYEKYRKDKEEEIFEDYRNNSYKPLKE